MGGRARRLLMRLRPASARRVGLMLCLGLTGLGTSAVAQITHAEYADPTPRYAHGVLGDAVEWGTLVVTLENGNRLRATLPETAVFEDLTPRLADLDNDGDNEVIVIETSLTKGARLAVWDETGRLAATPYIGRKNRWLAPVGAADLDGDGSVEIAYIDRPHLAKMLRIWRFSGNSLTHVTDIPGLTNHRIGWDHIPGGIRDCGAGPEIVTATGDWNSIAITKMANKSYRTQAVGKYLGPTSLNQALDCPN